MKAKISEAYGSLGNAKGTEIDITPEVSRFDYFAGCALTGLIAKYGSALAECSTVHTIDERSKKARYEDLKNLAFVAKELASVMIESTKGDNRDS
jgi:hypothetical protein